MIMPCEKHLGKYCKEFPVFYLDRVLEKNPDIPPMLRRESHDGVLAVNRAKELSVEMVGGQL
jgi:hypothetical protein